MKAIFKKTGKGNTKFKMDRRKKLGKIGEEIAVHYLEKNGYQIIERNFRCRRGEIDIIAWGEDEIVFVEVKTRTSKICGNPAEAVTRQKKKHLYLTAEYYMMLRKIEEYPVRMDVIEILWQHHQYTIHHIRQVY